MRRSRAPVFWRSLTVALALSASFASFASWATAVPANVSGVRPLGAAKLTVFGFEVYHARLWAGPEFDRDDYARHPHVLELTYLRDFKGRAIAERSLKEMRGVDAFTDAQAQAWLAALTQALPDVKKGDRLAGIYQPGKALRLLFNDTPLPVLNDPVLARIFMGIWLSPRTSEPAMREALLSGVNR